MSLYTRIIDRQKLAAAWSKVKGNKPAAGVDNVTYEEFDAARKENLAQLNTELVEHRYESLPVKMVYLYKGEKKRGVSLYCMRDKVVQQSIAAELVKIYDGQLSRSVYAYRPGRSALEAVGMLEKEIQKPAYSWILKTDIKSFFDTIVLQRLYQKLSAQVREQDVMDLIKACCEAKVLQKDGTLTPKQVGVYQGSGIAPVLSNVYLMDFDREMEIRYCTKQEATAGSRGGGAGDGVPEKNGSPDLHVGSGRHGLGGNVPESNVPSGGNPSGAAGGNAGSEKRSNVDPPAVYVRYSDDMIVLGGSREQMEEIRGFMRIRLEALGLALNEEKTTILPAEEGVDFLGYRLSSAGKGIPAKAEDGLQERLEKVWMGTGTTAEKLRKGSEILNGWEQYYCGERKIASIEEFAVVVYMVRGKGGEVLDKVKAGRRELENTYAELCRYLVDVWGEDDPALVLFEYEQYYGLSALDGSVLAGEEGPFLTLWEELFIQEHRDTWTELMQLYSDAGAYNKASKIMERIRQIESGERGGGALFSRTQESEPTRQGGRGEDDRLGLSWGIDREEEDRPGAARRDADGAKPSEEEAEKTTDNAPPIHDGDSRITTGDSYATHKNPAAESDTGGIPSTDRSIGSAAEDIAFVQAFLQAFAGREDTFGREEINNNRKRCVEQAPEPLTEDVIRAHLKGEYTASTYVQRTNATARFLVIDLDISKKCLLEEGSEAALRTHLPNAVNAAAQMLKLLKRLGLTGYPEFSGYRGFHIWVFFTEWIPTRYVNMLTDVIESKWENPYPDLTIEYFPNKGRLKNGSPGQCIKLPYGVHIRTGKRSVLLDEQFREVLPDRMYLKELAQFSKQAVKRIIGAHVDENELRDAKEVDRDLSAFGDLPESVRVVLENCNLMRYLCQKSRTTGYLSHFERLSVLYVFGHLGDEGKQFVHTVMEFTLNYKYHVTERFINRLPAKPVSCMKLRDQYQQITAEYGCSCNFKRTKNCYPSPVLHAIKTSGDLAGDVTVPTSKSISKEKEKQVVEELNIHKKVEDLAGKIVEMKKQKRGIDRNIQKVEKELERIYDQAGVDALEVSMGVMVRRRTENGYEWLIEI